MDEPSLFDLWYSGETWTSARSSHQIAAALLKGRSGDGGGQEGAMAAGSGPSFYVLVLLFLQLML
jgi:hypothetical protein